MKILLVGGYASDAEENPALQEFTEYINSTLGAEAETTSIYLDQLIFTIAPGVFTMTNGLNGDQLQGFDAIYIRGPKMRLRSELAYYVSRFCKFNGIKCVNDYSLYYPGTKVAQAIKFLEAEAPFLETIYSLDKQMLATSAVQGFDFPFILKTSVGSHGDSNYLVKSQEELQQILSDEPDTKFLAQAYCPNDRDYRLLLMQDQHLIFERRGSSDTHINNTSKGGEAQHTQEALPDEIIEKARSVSQGLGLMIAGVDVMPRLDTGEFFFLEVNSQPQLRTGALLNEKQSLLREFLLQSN